MWRCFRLATVGIAEIAVAIARGGLTVRAPEPPRDVSPWLLPLYDTTCLSIGLILGVLLGTYVAMAIVQLVADGRFPSRAGPVEFDDRPENALAQRSRESLKLIDELLSVVQDGRRREAAAQAEIDALKRRLLSERTQIELALGVPVRPTVAPCLASNDEQRPN
jgi:hypothetical protein